MFLHVPGFANYILLIKTKLNRKSRLEFLLWWVYILLMLGSLSDAYMRQQYSCKVHPKSLSFRFSINPYMAFHFDPQSLTRFPNFPLVISHIFITAERVCLVCRLSLSDLSVIYLLTVQISLIRVGVRLGLLTIQKVCHGWRGRVCVCWKQSASEGRRP